MRPIREFAPAKVNLTLRVLGRRSDGYHELESLVAFAAEVGDIVTLDTCQPIGVTMAGPFAGSIAGVNLVETMPYGLAGPAGMDPKVVDVIYKAFNVAMNDKRHLDLLAKYDMEMFNMPPAEFSEWALAEVDRQQALIAKFAEKAESKADTKADAKK